MLPGTSTKWQQRQKQNYLRCNAYFEKDDMIIYNYTGSDSYGIDDIPFSKIDEIVIDGDYL